MVCQMHLHLQSHKLKQKKNTCAELLPGTTKEDFNEHRIDEDNNLVILVEKKTENKEVEERRSLAPLSNSLLIQVSADDDSAGCT